MAAQNKRDRQQAFTLVEEATHLLRRTPATAWLGYFIGAVPFLLCLFFFWSDMSRSGTATNRLPEMSLLLSVLYAWMKLWQAWFCDRLMNEVRGGDDSRSMPFRGWLRLIASQMWIHATMPWVLILSFIALVPMPWAYAFYHNVTALAFDHFRRGGRTMALVRLAMAQTHWQPMQNVFLISLLHVGALFAYLNLLAGFAMGAFLLRSFTGIENPFTMRITLFFSLVVQAMLVMGCYLALNPFVKALYVLRCFYGASRKTGADIEVQLRALAVAKPLVLAVAVLGLCQGSLVAKPGAPAGPPTSSKMDEALRAKGDPGLNPVQLDQSIRDVLQGSEFQWRLPREAGPDGGEGGDTWLGAKLRGLADWIADSLNVIGRIIGDIIKWLFGGDQGGNSSSSGEGGSVWLAMLPKLLLALVIVLVAALLIMLFRNWQQSRLVKVAEAEVALPEINLESENIVASQLPENEWLRLAREKLEAGELRLALRALFLATLAHLGDKRLLHISRSKSNGDYVRELGFRARGREDLNSCFTEQVRTFDRVWYGWHEVNQDLMNTFEEQHERVTAHAS
jgi:hypothetical protein